MEGQYRKDGTFESTNVMVKHSNEYEAPHEGQDPKKMYESLVKPDAE
jgi:cytochrome c-type biogenesis protein CcmE